MLRAPTSALKRAILAAFSPVSNGELAHIFERFSESDWSGLGSWLHASGLALYLLDAACARGIEKLIPPGVLGELRQNHADNRERTAALAYEFAALNQAFTKAHLDYLCVKGFALGAPYVKDPGLRSQFDLDFWISDAVAVSCSALMQARGYAANLEGRTLECHSDGAAYPKLRDFYKPPVRRTVEIHLRPAREFEKLPRALGKLNDTVFPVLSRDRAFLEQALHLAKHLRSEWTRASWMLEFWSAAKDPEYGETLRRLQSSCTEEEGTQLGLAVASCAHAFQSPVPEGAIWATGSLPPGVCRWIEGYVMAAVTSAFPGTKLYLLLERELCADAASFQQKRRRALLPRWIPDYITRNSGGWFKADFVAHAKYAAMRCAFHVREGARLRWAERRWAEQAREAPAFRACERRNAA